MASPSKQTKALLKDLLKVTPLIEGDPDVSVVRRAYDEVFSSWNAPPSKPTREDWVKVEGLLPDDRALVVEPVGTTPPVATLVFLHGGGWMLGSALAYAPMCRWICAHTGLRVIAPDFPLAPEHPAPAAEQAIQKLLNWVGDTFDGALVLAGDSAGAQIAAILSNSPPEGVNISAQALFYPVLDLRETTSYNSRRKYGGGKYFLSNEAIVGAAVGYCQNLEGAAASPKYSPVLETDFSRTPPTYILAPELDPLFDEAKLYADKLRQSGVATELDVAKGTIHGCISFSGRVDEGLRSLQSACAFITKHI